MHVNGNSGVDTVPAMIGIRTKEFEPLLAKWRARNQRVPWTCLLRDALKKELAPLAGKRHARLVESKDGRVAA